MEQRLYSCLLWIRDRPIIWTAGLASSAEGNSNGRSECLPSGASWDVRRAWH